MDSLPFLGGGYEPPAIIGGLLYPPAAASHAAEAEAQSQVQRIPTLREATPFPPPLAPKASMLMQLMVP